MINTFLERDPQLSLQIRRASSCADENGTLHFIEDRTDRKAWSVGLAIAQKFTGNSPRPYSYLIPFYPNSDNQSASPLQFDGKKWHRSSTSEGFLSSNIMQALKKNGFAVQDLQEGRIEYATISILSFY